MSVFTITKDDIEAIRKSPLPPYVLAKQYKCPQLLVETIKRDYDMRGKNKLVHSRRGVGEAAWPVSRHNRARRSRI